MASERRFMAQRERKLPMAQIYYLESDTACSTTDGTRLFVSLEVQLIPRKYYNETNQILVVDASSRRWKRFALPLDQRGHCMEWHAGLLYVAGGIVPGLAGGEGPLSYLDSLRAYNEATGSWEDLPPMPHAMAPYASGVIGNRLFIAGGECQSEGVLSTTLLIYDIATRTWELGPPLPVDPDRREIPSRGVVVDEKLFVLLFSSRSMLVYDPHSESWAEEAAPPNRDIWAHSCVHNGRLVDISRELIGDRWDRSLQHVMFERTTDGSWSRCEFDGTGLGYAYVAESVLLG